MRALEVHIIETASDIDLAIQAGLLEPHRLDSSACAECEELVGYGSNVDDFEPFCVVIDIDDNDWVVCIDCSAPLTESSPVHVDPLIANLNLSNIFEDDDLDEF